MANIIPDDRWVVEDDGLFCQEVGPWAETKHNLVSYYGRLFSTGMKNKWDRRIYIELYAGAGYSRIRETLRIVAGSPLRALLLPHPFDRYIFCEKDSVSIESLKVRVKRIAPRADVVFIPGDCNDRMPDLLAAIPAGSREDRVLSLCFVDPCDIGIKFKTIRQLSNRYIDFLVLLALYMVPIALELITYTRSQQKWPSSSTPRIGAPSGQELKAAASPFPGS